MLTITHVIKIKILLSENLLLMINFNKKNNFKY